MRSERLLRDTHLQTDTRDQRRMDLVAAPGSRGLGARRGVALFADVTIVGVHTKRGEARTLAATTDGGVLLPRGASMLMSSLPVRLPSSFWAARLSAAGVRMLRVLFASLSRSRRGRLLLLCGGALGMLGQTAGGRWFRLGFSELLLRLCCATAVPTCTRTLPTSRPRLWRTC